LGLVDVPQQQNLNLISYAAATLGVWS